MANGNLNHLPQLLVLGVSVLAQSLIYHDDQIPTYDDYKTFKKELTSLAAEYGYDNPDEVFDAIQEINSQPDDRAAPVNRSERRAQAHAQRAHGAPRRAVQPRLPDVPDEYLIKGDGDEDDDDELTDDGF